MADLPRSGEDKEMSAIYTYVATGTVDGAFATAVTAGPLVRSGRLRFLALADTSRARAFPDVPTIAQSGGEPGFTLRAWVGLYAPKSTPAPLTRPVAQRFRQPSHPPPCRRSSRPSALTPGSAGQANCAAPRPRIRTASSM